MKVIVIGGGIIGLSCAYELAVRDAGVTVLDAGRMGDGASAANAGWVTPFLSAPRAAPGAVGDAMRGTLRTGGPARGHPHLDVGFLSWIARFLRASRPGAHRRGAAANGELAKRAGRLVALEMTGSETESVLEPFRLDRARIDGPLMP